MSTSQELEAGIGPQTNKPAGSASVAPIPKVNRLFDVEVGEVANSKAANGAYVLDHHAAEKELCWKLDTRIVCRLMGLGSLSP